MHLLNLKKVLVYKCHLFDGSNSVKALFINKRQESICISKCDYDTYLDIYFNGILTKTYYLIDDKIHRSVLHYEFTCLYKRKSKSDMPLWLTSNYSSMC